MLCGLMTLALLCVVTSSAWAKVRAVATVPDLAALLHVVGGDEVQVTSLIRASEDPHFVDAKPSLLIQLSRADLVAVNGMELEAAWFDPLLQNSRNGKIQRGGNGYFDASMYMGTAIEVPTVVDRSAGDIHAQGNPHFLLDPHRAVRVAEALAVRLSTLDPKSAAKFQHRAQDFARQIEELDRKVQTRVSKLAPASRQIVVYHASLGYLRGWLGLQRAASIEPRPGIPPDPRHVASVLNTMRELHVRLILQENYYPTKTSETLAKLTKARVVRIAGATDFDRGESYVQRMSDLADLILSGLGV